MKYIIRYNHTSAQTADSRDEAMKLVRTEAQYSIRGRYELVLLEVDDGTYIYPDQEAFDRDQTGAHAFAVISDSEAEIN